MDGVWKAGNMSNITLRVTDKHGGTWFYDLSQEQLRQEIEMAKDLDKDLHWLFVNGMLVSFDEWDSYSIPDNSVVFLTPQVVAGTE